MQEKMSGIRKPMQTDEERRQSLREKAKLLGALNTSAKSRIIGGAGEVRIGSFSAHTQPGRIV